MKKCITLLLLLAMILSLCACRPSNHAGSNVPSEPPETVPPVTNPPSTDPPADPVMEKRSGILYSNPFLWCPGMGHLQGVPMFMEVPEDLFPGMTVTADLKAKAGSFWIVVDGAYKILALEGVNKNNMPFYWDDYCRVSDAPTDDAVLAQDGAIFVEAVIRADGQIVGFGLFEIGSEDGFTYSVTRCECFIFPAIDGVLQTVSLEFVQQQLAELEKTHIPFDLEKERQEELEYWEYLNQLHSATNPTE